MKNGPYELVIAPPEYPGKLYRGKYVYEHHLVWWSNTGEVPGPGIDIHHKNEQKRDNRFDNLEKKTHSGHTSGHNVERGTPVVLTCFLCNKLFVSRGSTYRRKTKIGQTRFFCGRKCQVTQQQRDRWNIFRDG